MRQIDTKREWGKAAQRIESTSGHEADHGKAIDFAGFVYGHGAELPNGDIDDRDVSTKRSEDFISGYKLVASSLELRDSGVQRYEAAEDFDAGAWYDEEANTIYQAFRGTDD